MARRMRQPLYLSKEKYKPLYEKYEKKDLKNEQKITRYSSNNKDFYSFSNIGAFNNENKTTFSKITPIPIKESSPVKPFN